VRQNVRRSRRKRSLERPPFGPAAGQQVPPPTKCTISRRSPSESWVSGQRSRGTISRFHSTATRSDFIPICAMSAARVSGLSKVRGSPLISIFIAKEIFAGRTRADKMRLRNVCRPLKRTQLYCFAVSPALTRWARVCRRSAAGRIHVTMRLGMYLARALKGARVARVTRLFATGTCGWRCGLRI
jgi:hypothetical protein